MNYLLRSTLFFMILGLIISTLTVPVKAQFWPEIFDPLQLRTLNIEMDPADWIIVQNDETLDIELPAYLTMNGEPPMLVSIRRKSGDPLTEGEGYTKVSLKIDINEYLDGQTWHSLKKISLENGDDQDVVSEGFAWHLHTLASGAEGYGYPAGHGSWVKLYINGDYIGVYVSAEQRDKQFLRNRGLYVNGEVWLYKQGELNAPTLEVGEGNSATYDSLCYLPFHSWQDPCPTPSPESLAADLPGFVDMQAMLTMGVIDAIVHNGDAMFTHGKNFYFLDFLDGSPRMYFPWDQDSVIGGSGGTSIYPTGSAYADILLAVPEFHDLFTQIAIDLVTGPLLESILIDFLNQAEAVLTEALEADPNNQMDDVPGHFEGLRQWVSSRMAEIYAELDITTVDVPYSPDGPIAGLSVLSLAQPRPNPSLGAVGFDLVMPQDGLARLQVFDLAGRLVRTLIDGHRAQGAYSTGWDGLNGSGSRAPAGVYFIRLDVDGDSAVQRCIRLRE